MSNIEILDVGLFCEFQRFQRRNSIEAFKFDKKVDVEFSTFDAAPNRRRNLLLNVEKPVLAVSDSGKLIFLFHFLLILLFSVKHAIKEILAYRLSPE